MSGTYKKGHRKDRSNERRMTKAAQAALVSEFSNCKGKLQKASVEIAEKNETIAQLRVELEAAKAQPSSDMQGKLAAANREIDSLEKLSRWACVGACVVPVWFVCGCLCGSCVVHVWFMCGACVGDL